MANWVLQKIIWKLLNAYYSLGLAEIDLNL